MYAWNISIFKNEAFLWTNVEQLHNKISCIWENRYRSIYGSHENALRCLFLLQYKWQISCPAAMLRLYAAWGHTFKTCWQKWWGLQGFQSYSILGYNMLPSGNCDLTILKLNCSPKLCSSNTLPSLIHRGQKDIPVWRLSLPLAS